ncbi:DUF4091 domain-containing protein [bacterium]|nr:DUF4091 domain-containing protein [bacterium]
MSLSIWTQHSMSRIFPHQHIPQGELTPPLLYAARNEVGAFQIGVHGPSEALNDLQAKAHDLVTEKGECIPSECVDILFADYVPVHWHSAGNKREDLEGQAPGFYPDPLLPSLWRGVGRVQFPETISLWIRVRVPADASASQYQGKISITCKEGDATIPFSLQVWPFTLPERSHFLMTNWLLPGMILKFHKLEPLTETFWDVMELYARNLADHRQNVILTPLFPIASTGGILNGRVQDGLIDITETSPGQYHFDFENLDRWIELFLRYRFEVIEGGHLAGGARHPAGIIIRQSDKVERRSFASTQDADYRNFLGQFLTALRVHLQQRGWLKRFYLHLSDEPHGDQFEAYTDLAQFVKKTAPEFQLIDAMGSVEYAPYIDHPVPLESVYEQFVERSGIPEEQIWFYYCCGPTGAWPNRFIDYPLIRVRIFTWLAFKHGIPGFLHWGLNHWSWHRPHYRAEEYNPYDNTTGGSLQAGDSYLLYPPRMPAESHEPVDSIRWEIIRKAMEDYEYLYLLKEVAEGNNEHAQQARALLQKFNQEIVPNFVDHTRDANYLENFRKDIALVIAKAQ